MIRIKLRFITCIILFLCAWSQQITAQEQLTLDLIFDGETFVEKRVPGFRVLKNNTEYAVLEQSEEGLDQINIYQLKSAKLVKTVFENDFDLEDIVHFEWSFDEQYLLIYTKAIPIYRRSTLYTVYKYHIPTKSIELLDESPILHAHFNPVNYDVAYVKDNNLYHYQSASKQSEQLTFDGKKGQIINGNCDWVYEEEFAFSRAFEWSADGKYLAYYKFDESEVKEFTITFYDDGDNYPRFESFKYPKAGEDNSKVSIHVYDLISKNTQHVQTGDRSDFYIPRIKWAGKSNELLVYLMNRHQNHLEFLKFNPSSNTEEIIYEERNDYYIDITDNIAFDNQFGFYYTSEKNGLNQLFHWNWKTKTDQLISPEALEIDQIVGFDLGHGKVYFTAVGMTPMNRNFYSIDIHRGRLNLLIEEGGVVQVNEAGSAYFLVKSSQLNEAPQYYLLPKRGKQTIVLEQNQILNKQIQKYGMDQMEFFDLEWEGVTYHGWRILPPNFDETQKYPVIFYQYSGPGSQEVMDKFPIFQYYWHHFMAHEGYIIVALDGKGTGGRGEAFKKQTYLTLGALETESQIAFAEILKKEWSFVDGDRIGIWGWSYGGFISASALMKGNQTFSTAVSVAPVSNWAFYDNIYTERFMRTPQENPDGYKDNAPEQMVELLEGNLMIVHGLTDDNVHFQHAAVMTKNLIEAGKQFESLYYPNKNHSIPGTETRKQLFEKITDYFKRHL